MEPAKLKWESKLYTLSETIPTSNIDKVNNALETIIESNAAVLLSLKKMMSK